MLKLDVEKRDPKTDLEEIRKGGNLPAVFYGNEVESTPISVSANEFKKLWKKSGSSSLITLSGINKDKEVVIQDLDIDPITNQVRHVDFYVIKRGQVMETNVCLEFVGISPAVKELGGILVKVTHELEIEVLPKDLPQSIKVDISALKELDSQITIKDLVLPEGVKVLNEANEVVAAISQATEEVETGPIDISEIEIEKKGKKEEEGGGEEAPAK